MDVLILSISYSVHLLATAVWAGGLLLMAVMVYPAWRLGSVDNNNWLNWQKRLMPWINGSLVLLLITGFYQMTSDTNYTGFLNIDSTWAWAMLFKHIAYVILVVAMVWLQFGLHPSMERTAVLAQKRPQLAATEQAKLEQQEQRLLTTNLILAVVILVCTAVATAV
ncbi:MAG: CopD family protein [Chloroflexota bacterium]